MRLANIGSLRRGVVALALMCITCIACVAAVCACASPTLPLPPPSEPLVSPGPDGQHVTLGYGCGGAEPNAIIVVRNLDPNVPLSDRVTATLADGCGAWTTTVFANPGDCFAVWQEVGNTRSPDVGGACAPTK
jgi:hypothetical protein